MELRLMKPYSALQLQKPIMNGWYVWFGPLAGTSHLMLYNKIIIPDFCLRLDLDCATELCRSDFSETRIPMVWMCTWSCSFKAACSLLHRMSTSCLSCKITDQHNLLVTKVIHEVQLAKSQKVARNLWAGQSFRHTSYIWCSICTLISNKILAKY